MWFSRRGLKMWVKVLAGAGYPRTQGPQAGARVMRVRVRARTRFMSTHHSMRVCDTGAEPPYWGSIGSVTTYILGM